MGAGAWKHALAGVAHEDVQEWQFDFRRTTEDTYVPPDVTPEDTYVPPVCVPGSSSGKTASGAHGLVWVEIPAGCFMMGCSPGDGQCGSDETDSSGKQHAVTVAKFEMLETEVTEAQYAAVMAGVMVQGSQAEPDPSGDYNGGGGADSPVENVSWYHAGKFCEEIGGRLPTEAEWEYAARGGKTTKYYCGDSDSCLGGIAWYSANSDDGPGLHKHDVKGKDPNDYGLYDMLGNVWEWVEDCYHSDYDDAPSVGYPDWSTDCGSARVRRGGDFASYAYALRVSVRYVGTPGYDYYDLGFRCAR